MVGMDSITCTFFEKQMLSRISFLYGNSTKWIKMKDIFLFLYRDQNDCTARKLVHPSTSHRYDMNMVVNFYFVGYFEDLI